MIMVLFYERINWENYPSMNTAINALNLNKIDLAVKTLDERTVQLDTTKAEQATVLNTVQDWSLDESTGIITITKVNGEKISFDLNIEKIPVNFELSEDGILTMTTDDGTMFTADIGSMIPIIELEGSSTVSVTKEKVITELATNIKNFSHTFEEPFTGKICIKASFNQTYNAKIITEDGEIGGFVSGPYFPYVKNALSFSVESTHDLERIYLDYSQIQKYKIEIPDGAITEQKLNPNYLADLKLQAENATQSATSASASATQASESATRAYDEAERAKLYADTVQEGITTTTSRTLTESHAGGLKINSMDGESQQDGTPTPDTPIDIKSVEISEIKSVWKNLFDRSSAVLGAEFFGGNGLPTTDNSVSVTTIQCEPSTNYTVSDMIGGQYARFNYLTKNGEFISRTLVTVSSGTATLSTPENCYKLQIAVDNSMSQLMLSEGSVALPWEPYTEKSIQLSAPITLRGIGDVKDVLCKRDGAFGVLREYSPFIIDGTQNIYAEETEENGYRFRTDVSSDIYVPASMSIVPYVMCNRFIPSKWTDIYYGRANGIGTNSKAIGWYDEKFKDYTVEEMKTWLATNNMIGFCKLTTPTFEPLPLADQIALHQLETFDTVTYISTDSEIEPIMEVEYGTSKIGAYAIKGMNTADANALKIEQLNTLTNELATQLVAGSEV